MSKIKQKNKSLRPKYDFKYFLQYQNVCKKIEKNKRPYKKEQKGIIPGNS